MCRVAGSYFNRLRTSQPAMSGRRMSSVIAAGRSSRAKLQALVAARSDHAFEPAFPPQLDQQRNEAYIVLDDQQDLVARRNDGAIIDDIARQQYRRFFKLLSTASASPIAIRRWLRIAAADPAPISTAAADF